MTENDVKIQDAINSIRKRQSLSSLVKPNKQTQDAIIILEELIRLATFVQEVQPQLHFFNLFGQIVAREREEFAEDENYQDKFNWLASMETQAQQETQAQVQAAMEAQQAQMNMMQAEVEPVDVVEATDKPSLRLV